MKSFSKMRGLLKSVSLYIYNAITTIHAFNIYCSIFFTVLGPKRDYLQETAKYNW